jgi:hypothetical protein
VLLAACLLASTASAGPFDPALPERLPSSLPKGAAVAERVDAEGRNLTSVALPLVPSVVWQARVAAPLHGPPLADGQGSLIVAHGHGRLSELDASGRTRWSLRTGLAFAGPPLLVGGALRVVVGETGEVVAVSETGRVVHRERVGSGEFEATLVSSPARDGGAILAAGARLIRLGPRGRVAWSASTSDPIRAVFDWRGQALAVGKNGVVLVRSAAGDPEEIANLGGAVTRAALAADSLFALVGPQKFVELDLRTRTQRVRFSDGLLALAEFALGAAAQPRLLSVRGVLVTLDAGDRELARASLVTEGGAGDSAGLVVDPAGTALVAFAGAPLAHVTPQGDVSSLAGTACPDPVRPTPLRSGFVVAACRSGLLRGLSDRGR